MNFHAQMQVQIGEIFFFGGDYLLSIIIIIITDFCRLSSFMLFMFIFTNSGFG